MKNTIVLLVSVLMMLSPVSCKKKVEGKKADTSASGFYCYGKNKCDFTLQGEVLAYHCTGTRPNTLKWNDKEKGYIGETAMAKIKMLYVDYNLLVSFCNDTYSVCDKAEVYTRCK
jgi:hypothetical protein